MKPLLKDLKKLPYGGAGAVDNPQLDQVIASILHQAQPHQWLADTNIQNEFLTAYHDWIKSTSLNSWQGLDQFGVRAYSNGTTESFDKFYLKNHHRRFRCFKGEYMYHQVSWRNYFPNWCYLDDAPLAANDAVVLSLPFADTGEAHLETDNVLDQATRLGVPVLLDCAFFGVCQGINYNLNYECITDLTFSLSKTLPVANARIGMRLSRLDDDDSLLVHHKTNYTNRLGSGLGLNLLKLYGPDWNCQTYGNTQQEFCRQLGVKASKSVIFGLATDSYPEYNRGTGTSRLNLSKYLATGILPHA